MSIKMRFQNGTAKALTLSYDDGNDTDLKLMEIMSKHGLKGTFNLNSSKFFDGAYQDVKKIYIDSGNEIACHGVYHKRFAYIKTPEMIHEILDDRENLEKDFNTIVRGMAYAYGYYDSNVIEILKLCGICYSRTVHSTLNFSIPTNWYELNPTCHHKDEKLPELTDTFLNASGDIDPMLFYVWGHSFEFEKHNNWYIIEDFASKTGNRDDIWYATNIEIYDYIESFNRLQFSADCKIIHNPNAIDIWASIDGNIIKIASGETVRL